MILANAQELMEQASTTAGSYMGNAVRYIDDQLGKGYASQHPELVIAMIQAATIDFSVAIAIKNMDEWVEKITLTILNYPEE